LENTIVKAELNDKPILQRLLELYAYDFSEFDNADLNIHGEYGYPRLDYYWNETDRYAYLLKTDNNISGFSMIRTEYYNNTNTFSMAEFFILKKYRFKGIGKYFALNNFKMHLGDWEVPVMKSNLIALKFWENILKEKTNNKYEISKKDNWDGPVFKFKINE